jgi:hypothetical protein
MAHQPSALALRLHHECGVIDAPDSAAFHHLSPIDPHVLDVVVVAQFTSALMGSRHRRRRYR